MLRRLFALLLLTQTVCADEPRMQLFFLGAAPDAGAPGKLPESIPIISLANMPAESTAEQTIFAAKLRANSVSSFVVTANDDTPERDQFFVVTQVRLSKGSSDSFALTLGEQSFPIASYTQRMDAVFAAFTALHRRVGFIRIADPEDEFPLAVGELQRSLGGLGFDLLVLMVGKDFPHSDCVDPAQGLHWSVVSGLADRAPFGDADGVSSVAEVEAFLSGALKRSVTRKGDCGLKYSVLLKGTLDPSAPVVEYSGRALFAELETQLFNESFDAMFLLDGSDRDGVQNYLDACVYCPNELALTEHLQDMEEFARTSALEAQIWNRIARDQTPQRLAIYLQNCSPCNHRTEAEALIAELRAKAAAYDGEKLAYEAATRDRDVTALRVYATTCIACTFQSEAETLVARIEADAAYQAEKTAFVQAMDSRDVHAMQAYLDSCQICEGRAELTAALAHEIKRAEFLEPCLKLAALPQLGGPRRFEAIDQAEATRVCTRAQSAFPKDGLVLTTLGRIAQAGGNIAEAQRAYRDGMEAGVPAAFGLAAYAHYAPPENTEIDLATAEQFARQGAELGDWLSQEILAVLYSKDLVPGKTQGDGFRVAENIAKQGNALAEFLVGYYFLTGTGVEANAAKAKIWLQRSVGQGYTHANSFLAEIHETGAGGDAAPDIAAELYWQALVKGDQTAADRLTNQLRDRDRAVIRIIQEKLRAEGNYRGPLDGLPGPSTVNAVRAFAEAISNQS